MAAINLVIGGNGSGKTFLLKSLYATIRTIEEFNRGNDQRTAAEILSEKLYWTFQVDKIGDLVTKGADSALSFRAKLDGKNLSYSFGKDTTKNILSFETKLSGRESNSIFLPAKEVLSLLDVILKSREQDKLFGFDDTYLDLARALRLSTRQGKNYTEFANSRRKLEEIIDGRVEIDKATGRWQFRRGNQRFQIGVTAEGIKKIAILDTLLGNRYLSPSSIVFIDEPEAALHPVAVSEFLEIIAMLADCGIQFFIASHSYFVIKKLYLLAQQRKWSIPVLSFQNDEWHRADLLEGMPSNPIIDESIRIYEEELRSTLP